MKRFTTLILLTFLFGNLQLNAQGFKAYLALGTNVTDDNLTESGNSQVGTRLGLIIGPGVSGLLNERWETSMELLYSQNGHYVKYPQLPTIGLNKIRLDYLEVPITFAYRFNIKKNEQKESYKQRIGGGITYARLFNYKFIAIDGTNATNDIRFDQENAFLFNITATSFFRESFALNGKVTVSMFGKFTYALRFLYYL